MQQDQHQERSTTETISAMLFTAARESILRRATWNTRGLRIDKEYISRIRVTDDILIAITRSRCSGFVSTCSVARQMLPLALWHCQPKRIYSLPEMTLLYSQSKCYVML